ncbi:DUF1428 domain-containing protein [Jannaschia sp. 2305UL9-9]|uniref:DUF1428 domain-containing protein n=1 Tax=Jannaschia sp. 2305UL9-9 TaxID=3121638 RepID=UPI003527E69E
MSYFAGFVAAVPADAKDAYIAHAQESWEVIFKPLGALRLTETWGDDVPEGEITSFPMAVKRAEGEVVVFSWIEWPDKATHDAANARMFDQDPEFAEKLAAMGEMPFDGKRMIYGGFEEVLDLQS